MVSTTTQVVCCSPSASTCSSKVAIQTAQEDQIQVDETNKTQRELDQKAAEYIEAKSRLEFVTRRYKLVEKLKSRDLQESQNTKKVIRLKKTDE